MSSYFDSTGLDITNGDTSDQVDINGLVAELVDAFNGVEVDVLANASNNVQARLWSNEDTGVLVSENIGGSTYTGYSARAYQMEAQEWAESNTGSITKADGTLALDTFSAKEWAIDSKNNAYYPEDEPVPQLIGSAVRYSSLHWASKSEESADAASISETNAAASAAESIANSTISAGDGISVAKTGSDPYDYEVTSIPVLRNEVINPNMAIVQDDTWSSGNALYQDDYGPDLWKCIADVSSSLNYVNFDVSGEEITINNIRNNTGSTNFVSLSHNSQRLNNLTGKQVTLQIEVVSDPGANLTLRQGSNSIELTSVGVFHITFTKTTNDPIELGYSLPPSTTGSFGTVIKNIKLAVEPRPSAYEVPVYQDELKKCQEYYFVIDASGGTNPSYVGFGFGRDVFIPGVPEMINTPTVTFFQCAVLHDAVNYNVSAATDLSMISTGANFTCTISSPTWAGSDTVITGVYLTGTIVFDGR